jgi:hypothetical protein
MPVNIFQYRLQRVQHIMIPKPDNLNSCSIQNFRTFFVIQCLLILVMTTTIKLNRQRSIMAIEMPPSGCCRRNLKPQNRRPLNICQSRLSASVCWLRSCLAKPSSSGGTATGSLTLALSLRERELLPPHTVTTPPSPRGEGAQRADEGIFKLQYSFKT